MEAWWSGVGVGGLTARASPLKKRSSERETYASRGFSRTTQKRGEVKLPVDIVAILDASAGPCQDLDPTRFTPLGLATRPCRTRRPTGASSQPSVKNNYTVTNSFLTLKQEI
ncbi:hypothetical protein NL676_006790 [Syzygium grande]|nr:hypothetical protein NL676_006790 [Syzygium grande]